MKIILCISLIFCFTFSANLSEKYDKIILGLISKVKIINKECNFNIGIRIIDITGNCEISKQKYYFLNDTTVTTVNKIPLDLNTGLWIDIIVFDFSYSEGKFNLKSVFSQSCSPSGLSYRRSFFIELDGVMKNDSIYFDVETTQHVSQWDGYID
jgi:hypothetical protein